jgi:NADH-quinone oxidoreductase subunit H
VTIVYTAAISTTILARLTGAAEVVTVAQRAANVLETNIWLSLGYMLVALAAIGALVAFLGMGLIYAERKIAAHFQCRLGPMRVGPHGILQTVADTIKLFLKEDIVPSQADKIMHLVAPFLALSATVLILAVIPYSPLLQVANPNIGILFVTAVSGLSVMGILLGGWSSNNKWSLIGGRRSAAQVISYEISATLAALVVVGFSGTLSLAGIVQSQQAGWWIWRMHGIGIISFSIFIIASTAEINRTPFDIAEGESELTGGFHTEYSGLRFAFFFLAEFVNMFVASAIAVTMFLGGWMPFYVSGFEHFNRIMAIIPPVIWFAGKTSFLIFIFMWFRWTFPRLRVDQLMRLEWKILVPIGLANLVAASVVIITKLYFFPE